MFWWGLLLSVLILWITGSSQNGEDPGGMFFDRDNDFDNDLYDDELYNDLYDDEDD